VVAATTVVASQVLYPIPGLLDRPAIKLAVDLYLMVYPVFILAEVSNGGEL
jgi:hypothetical protein